MTLLKIFIIFLLILYQVLFKLSIKVLLFTPNVLQTAALLIPSSRAFFIITSMLNIYYILP